jgi:hypothetical protein
MYWVKYLFFSFMSLPVAWLFESEGADWLPRVVPTGMTAQLPFICLLLLACGGRFGDVASTLSALEMPFLAEGAPSLGRSPTPKTLSRFLWAQLAGIIVGGTVLSFASPSVARGMLVLVALVSFDATVSNLVLSIAAMDSSVWVHHFNISITERYREEGDTFRGSPLGSIEETRGPASLVLDFAGILGAILAVILSPLLVGVAALHWIAVVILFVATIGAYLYMRHETRL